MLWRQGRDHGAEWDWELDEHHRTFSAANAAGDYSAIVNNWFSYVAQMVGVSRVRGSMGGEIRGGAFNTAR